MIIKINTSLQSYLTASFLYTVIMSLIALLVILFTVDRTKVDNYSQESCWMSLSSLGYL